MRIGVVTIGQSPRVDVMPEFRRALGLEAQILERGALDGLGADRVGELAPREGDYILVTRMSDGTEVKIAERHVIGRVGGCIRELEAEGVELVVLICTGEFPGLAGRKLLLMPDRILDHLAAALLPRGVLGVVLPSAEQIPLAGRKWMRAGRELACEAVSPYSAAMEEIERTAHRLKEKDPALIVLDCIGFGEAVREVFRRITGKPVVLPRTVLGRVAGALL